METNSQGKSKALKKGDKGQKKKARPKKRKSAMKNLVGARVPSVAEVGKATDWVNRAITGASDYTILLTTEGRQATLKFRSGGDAVVARVASLATAHGAVIPNTRVGDMLNDQTLAERLEPIQPLLARLAQRASDTIFEARAEAWWAATSYYGILDEMSVGDAALFTDLGPVREFFAIGPRTEDDDTAANAAPAAAATGTATTAAAPAAKPAKKRKPKSPLKNLVGDKLPSTTDVQKWTDWVQRATDACADYTILLHPSARGGGPNYREGADKIIQIVATLATRYGAVVPNVTVEQMTAKQALADRLAPFQEAAQRLSQRIADTILQARSECWWAATTYYGILDKMSAADAVLNADLEPVRRSLATGARATSATDEK